MNRCRLALLGSVLIMWSVPSQCSLYDDIVQQANDALLAEEGVLHTRRMAGVDNRVSDFRTLVPSILGAHTQPLLPAQINRGCKLINHIHRLARSFHMNGNLSMFLGTITAQRLKVNCPFVSPTCGTMPRRFRSFDGSCNNRLHPLWGAAYTPFPRELNHAYHTEMLGEESVRMGLPRSTGVDGSPLPSARLISNLVHRPSERPVGTTLTSLYTNVGQSISHDITDTPTEIGEAGANVGCCNQTEPTQRCFNIAIPEDDEYFRDFGRTCMGMTRSAEVTDVLCSTGVREQMNIASSFLDLTQTYGHNADHAARLRDEEGLLKRSTPNHLPLQAHPNLKAQQHGINYFMAGDEKNGEFTGLIGVTTLLQREHNRIASKLFKLKKNFFRGPIYENNSEKTFFHTRKIVIAVFQHIVYNEYLPLTMGPGYMTKYNLSPLRRDYYQGYNPTMNPSVTNVVSTAAMRFGHSMVRNTYSILDRNYAATDTQLRLKKIYWRDNFYLLFENGFQRGVLVDDSEKCDRHMAEDLKNHMFETKPGNGLDLAALNIQRGRDHGLPPYNQYRRLLLLAPATEWSTDPVRGFKDMSEEVVNKLKAVYKSPEDVDVWTGGISETPVPGGQVGPLFAELLGRQFQRLREGDFYWYESAGNGFTLDQLSEIRKYSLAKLICNNFPVENIQPRVFQLHTVPGNGRVSCDLLPDINLYTW